MVKGAMTFSLKTEVCDAVDKVVASGRFKSKSAFVERCILEHFEPEFPDIENQELALKRASELEFAARGYRDQAVNAKKKSLEAAHDEMSKVNESLSPVEEALLNPTVEEVSASSVASEVK